MTEQPVQRTWPELLSAVLRRDDLSVDDAAWAMDRVMTGEATPAQVAGLAVALRAKGETVDEIEGFVRSMYSHALLIDVPGATVDIVGTGGDRAHTVNISTMSAVVAAGAGATVVKHGNRAASSSSGAADVLERLGVRLDLAPEAVAQVAKEAGITFCFAPVFHASLRHAGVPRKELAIPTFFNFLGPLTNPARPRASAVGVFDERMAPIVAGVFARRGVEALVFRGDDGLDEISVATTTTVWTASDGEVRRETFDPRDVGIAYSPISALRGADPEFNAAVARRLLAGEQGAVRDAVLLSSAAALAALEPTREPVTTRLAAGLEKAAEAIDSGAAERVLGKWVEVSERLIRER
ncbi:anthranilate phosphoribosyltransferase [Catenulispora sp. NF23]|uniref:Anthranilate phosphoribosyltransferase n=1 Tax=Catenulispora pinistramenti TaxID=2705254 RepID=A0ABS5KUP8_9ACTN|nr:anthranilate phosphoribosyltransferase [Catenulispora pinistramenti]MBS2534138.1 anthranilate phosphoribosyltransferase [Catenulispora pinistramenti]MBS2549759.1 anthranilate phosphoribosyltransferase [Catenulispora pinistramenti]